MSETMSTMSAAELASHRAGALASGNGPVVAACDRVAETIHSGAILTATGVTDGDGIAHYLHGANAATDADIAFAAARKRDALWYAFGITDGSATLSEQLCEAIRASASVGFSPAITFADASYAAALAHRLGTLTCLPSVQGAWQAFVADLIG